MIDGHRDAGIDLDDVFQVLEDEGVQKFVDSWDELTEPSQTSSRVAARAGATRRGRQAAPTHRGRR